MKWKVAKTFVAEKQQVQKDHFNKACGLKSEDPTEAARLMGFAFVLHGFQIGRDSRATFERIYGEFAALNPVAFDLGEVEGKVWLAEAEARYEGSSV